MPKLINVNVAWVSRRSFLEYSKRIAKLSRDTFTRSELKKYEKIGAALHKVRANLKFFVDMELIYRTNGDYNINQEVAVLNFFRCLREDKEDEAMEYLRDWLHQLPFFQRIFSEFFIDDEVRNINEFSDFLMRNDREAKKPHQYVELATFFAKFLDKIGYLTYHSRAHTMKLCRDDKITKYLSKSKKESEKHDLILVYNNKKINLPKDLFIKIINKLPEQEREQILLELL